MRYWMKKNSRFPEYVPVAERRLQAEKEAQKMAKKGQKTNPVVIKGRKIAETFWGKAWCDSLESYSDYENRLPRGRTYVRNGSVIDLQITSGKVNALVMGSSLYKIAITMSPMPDKKWSQLVKACSGKIESLIELLQGKFSKAVMEIITQPKQGLFPHPKEIKLSCSCPDWADMCKHVAAALYGVGAILDHKPEYLFTLRQVDHLDLIAQVDINQSLMNVKDKREQVADDDLSSLFGIEMDMGIDKKSVKPKKKTVAKVKAKTKVTEKQKKSTAKTSVVKKKSVTTKVKTKTTSKPRAKPKAPSVTKVKAKSIKKIETPKIKSKKKSED